MVGLIPIGLVVFGLLSYLLYTRWRDWSIHRQPFPSEWLAILENTLPVYAALSSAQQAKLRQLIKFFIARKKFYGCAGLTVTDEMRVVIAAEACLLVLARKGALYPKLKSVLVYPTAFRVDRQEYQADGTVSEQDDVTRGAADFSDGHNVVLHEFAHQLDSESGMADGAPPLRSNSYRAWAAIFNENFRDLEFRSMRGLETVMDEYGATNPAEFFAVATETFFEKPHQLYKRRPDLYRELQAYYQLDPRQWSTGA